MDFIDVLTVCFAFLAGWMGAVWILDRTDLPEGAVQSAGIAAGVLLAWWIAGAPPTVSF